MYQAIPCVFKKTYPDAAAESAASDETEVDGDIFRPLTSSGGIFAPLELLPTEGALEDRDIFFARFEALPLLLLV